MTAREPDYDIDPQNLRKALDETRLSLNRQRQRATILSQVIETQEGMVRRMLLKDPAVPMFPFRTAKGRLALLQQELSKVNDACASLYITIAEGETTLKLMEEKAAETERQVVPFRGPAHD